MNPTLDPPRGAWVARKVALTAVVVGALPLVTAGFVTIRPNRLAAGEAVHLWTAAGSAPSALVLGAWFLLFAACLRPFPERARAGVLGWIPCLLGPALLLLAGQVAARTALEAGPIARVSLGPALWIGCFALPMVFADTFQRADRRTRLFLGAGAVLAGAVVVGAFAAGWLDHLSVLKEYANRQDRFFREFRTHLALSGAAVGFACAIGVPLGLLAHRRTRLEAPTFFALNTLQTVPSLALFSILIPVIAALTARLPVLADFGVRAIGAAPALIALSVYSILPVARNTHVGFRSVDPAMVEAGLGMGMTRPQLLWRVELPIAGPIILNGFRIALVQALGLTAVAALIGAGGFGVFIFQGLGQAANDLILLGAIPTVLIAVTADGAMQGLIALARPRGLR